MTHAATFQAGFNTATQGFLDNTPKPPVLLQGNGTVCLSYTIAPPSLAQSSLTDAELLAAESFDMIIEGANPQIWSFNNPKLGDEGFDEKTPATRTFKQYINTEFIGRCAVRLRVNMPKGLWLIGPEHVFYVGK